MQLSVSVALSIKCTGQKGQALVYHASDAFNGVWNEETKVFLYLHLLGCLLSSFKHEILDSCIHYIGIRTCYRSYLIFIHWTVTMHLACR